MDKIKFNKDALSQFEDRDKKLSVERYKLKREGQFYDA